MDLDEILTALGYKNINDKYNEDTNVNFQNKSDDVNIDDNLNTDIPGGFRDLNPLLFITIGEVIGDIISGNLPFNTANSISNFLTLVGQIIETCGTQQQYFESGPGGYFYENFLNNSFPRNESDKCNNEENEKSDIYENDNINEKEQISILEMANHINKIQKQLDIISGQINLINNDITALKNHFQ